MGGSQYSIDTGDIIPSEHGLSELPKDQMTSSYFSDGESKMPYTEAETEATDTEADSHNTVAAKSSNEGPSIPIFVVDNTDHGGDSVSASAPATDERSLDKTRFSFGPGDNLN